MKERNQLLIVATNSFWNTANFILAGVFGFVFSIILTRYLGPKGYGQYGYIFSIIAVLILIFELGAGQAISKYIPKYFSDEKNKYLAIRFFKIFTLVQFLASSIFIVLFYLTKDIWLNKIDISFLPNGLIVILLLYIPLISSVNTLVSFVGSSQNYKKIAVANLITYIINLALLLLGVYFKLSLEYFIFVNVITNIFVGIVLYIYSKSLFANLGKAEKVFNRKESFNFTFLAYVNLLVQYVVFSYSEIFFLKKYSSIENLGFYTLAFMIAGMVVGILATSQRAIYNAQFELLEQNQEAKADTMTYLTIKYSAIIFLPLVILASLIMSNLIGLVYGSAYLAAGLVFPYIILASTISVIFTPIQIKASNNNKVFSGVIAIIAGGAVINLLADYLLIPKYELIGAGYANLIGQAVTILLITIYVLKKIKFNFNLNKITTILLVNIALVIATFSFYKLHFGISLNLLYCIVIFIVYVKVLKTLKQFETMEYDLVKSLTTHLPESLRSVFGFIYKVYKRI